MITAETFDPIRSNQLSVREQMTQRIWAAISWWIFRFSPWFAHRYRLLWVHVFGGRYVSWHSGVSRTAKLDYPWRLTLGKGSSLGEGVWAYCMDRISIGDNCCIGDGVKLLTGSHDITSRRFSLVRRPIEIGDMVWIATNATVLPGVTIGSGAVVGAGAVVTEDVVPWTVVAGNPAREIKKRVLV